MTSYPWNKIEFHSWHTVNVKQFDMQDSSSLGLFATQQKPIWNVILRLWHGGLIKCSTSQIL